MTDAKRLTARSSVRRREAAESEDDESGEETKAVTNYSTRAVLTNTFGTKKSKKAVQAIAENRLLARGGDDANKPLSDAILSSMPESDMPDDTDTRQLAQSNKPLPVPDLHTNDVNLAYPLTSLVFPSPPASTLDQLPLSAWIDSVTNNKPVNASSRFVANRIIYLIRAHTSSPSDAILKLNVQLLRYMLLLLELTSHLRTLRSHARIPLPSTWPPKTITGNLSFTLIAGTLAHFFPNNQISTAGTTLLHTTILALALHIPPPSFQVTPGTLVSEPTDLQMDLALKPEVCRKYYTELGCKMENASDAELSLWGLEKMTKKRRAEEGKKSIPRPKWAKLKLPLVFPTLSVGRQQKRR
jgi:DNA-directed RNA polymerase I subunit RPA49